MKIESGHTALLQYEVRDEDGVVHESSTDHGPMDFTPGEELLPPALEAALVGQAEGAEVSVTLPPEDAFGTYDPGVLVTVPRSRFGEDAQFEVGSWVELEFETEDGDDADLDLEDMEMRVVEANADAVVLDGNHPLAGKTVTFQVKVLAVREG